MVLCDHDDEAAFERSSTMSITKVIEVVGRSSESSDAAVKNALAEAGRNLRDVKALDVVSIGLRGDNLDEWGALVRISFLVDNVND
jgi:flavin-binding protein dodecin